MITTDKADKADERNNLLKIVFTWDGVEHMLISAKNLKEKSKEMNPDVLLMIEIDSPGEDQPFRTISKAIREVRRAENDEKKKLQ